MRREGEGESIRETQTSYQPSPHQGRGYIVEGSCCTYTAYLTSSLLLMLSLERVSDWTVPPVPIHSIYVHVPTYSGTGTPHNRGTEVSQLVECIMSPPVNLRSVVGWPSSIIETYYIPTTLYVYQVCLCLPHNPHRHRASLSPADLPSSTSLERDSSVQAKPWSSTIQGRPWHKLLGNFLEKWVGCKKLGCNLVLRAAHALHASLASYIYIH